MPPTDEGQNRQSLESVSPQASVYVDTSSLESTPAPVKPEYTRRRPSLFKFNKLAAIVTGAAFLIIGLIVGSALIFTSIKNGKDTAVTSQKGKFQVTKLNVNNINQNLQVDSADKLSVNGQLKVSNTLVLAPTSAPTAPTTGQIYYNKTDNALYYYNGSTFVPIANNNSVVSSLGGMTGAVNAGAGLSAVAGSLQNTGVLTVQGASGNVNFTAGGGVVISGTTISTVALPAGQLVLGTGSSGFTSVAQASTPGQCLISTSGAPVFGSCTGTTQVTSLNGLVNGLTLAAGAGVTITSNGVNTLTIAAPAAAAITSVNGQIGPTLTVANATGSGNTITINNAAADGSTKGIAAFNATNFSASSGVIDTIQGISTGASPTFANLTSSGYLKGVTVRNSSDEAFTIPSNSGNGGTLCYVYGGNSNCPTGGNVSRSGTVTLNYIPKFDANNGGITNSELLVLTGGLQYAGTGYLLDLVNGSDSTLTVDNSGAGVANLAISGKLSASQGLLNGSDTFLIPTNGGNGGTLCYVYSGSSNCPTGGNVSFGTTHTTNKLTAFDGSGNLVDSELSTLVGGVQYTGTSYLLDLTNASNSTLTVDNSGAGVANLSVSGSVTANGGLILASGKSLQAAAGGIDINSGTGAGDTITFYTANGANSFILPTTGGLGQTICTTAITCASGGGRAVLLDGTSAQTSANTKVGIFISKAAGASGNLLQLQYNSSDRFVINNQGELTSYRLAAGTAGTDYVTVSSAAQSGVVNLSVPTVTAGNYDICLSSGNCAGTGGGITGAGTGGKIALFTGTGASGTIGDSALTQAGSDLTASGNLTIQGSAGLTLGTTGVNGKVSFTNSTNSNKVTLQGGVSGSDFTLTLPTGDGGANECLATDGAGQLIFQTCLSGGGGGGGVTFFNSRAGAITLQGTTNQVTVTESPTNTFTLSLPQDIHTAAAPTFAGLTLSGLSNGVVKASGGVLSTGGIVLGTDTTGNYVASIGTVTGLTLGGTNGVAGGVPTLAVNYGSSSGTAVQGNTQLTVTAGTGLSGGGTITLGSGGTTTLNVTYGSTANTAVQGNTQLTITAGTGLTGGSTVTLGSGGTSTLNVAYGSSAGTAVEGNKTLTCPTITGTNLTGGGGTVTLGSGGSCTAIGFTNSPTFTGDATIQGSNGVTIGTTSGVVGTLALNDGNGQKTTLQAGDSAGDLTFILPTNSGSANYCLKKDPSNTTQLVWDACLGGSGGGVSINLQQAYDNSTGGTTPEILLSSAQGGLDIQNKFTGGVASGNLLAVRSGVSGDLTTGSTVMFGINKDGEATFRSTLASSTAAFQVQNAGGSPMLTVNNNNGQVESTRLYVSVGSTTPSLEVNQNGTGNIFQANDNGAAVATIADGGKTTFKNSVNNGAAFQVQNSTNSPVINVDTDSGTFTAGAQYYSSGTISQSGSTITGSGTIWTNAMKGGMVVYSDGSTANINTVNSSTSLSVTVSKTVTAGSSYTIRYGGLDVYAFGGGRLQTTTNSYYGFMIQNANADSLLNADTVTMQMTQNGNGVINGGLQVGGISVPSAPTVTPQGTTGATTYTYVVTARNANGGETTASSTGTTATGNATLSGVNYNRITFPIVVGAKDYRIYRTVGGATQGLIGTATSTTDTVTFNDTGLPASGSAPTNNTSGSLTVNGNALFKPITNNTTAFQIQNAGGTSILSMNSVTADRGGNLVVNGSFETDVSSWTRSGGAGMTRSTSFGLYGTASMFLDSSNVAMTATGNLTGTLSTSTTYTLSYYTYTTFGLGQTLSATIAGTTCSASVLSATWVKNTCTFTTPVSPTYNTMVFNLIDTGFIGSYYGVYIDGVRIEAGGTAYPYQQYSKLSVNGDIDITGAYLVNGSPLASTYLGDSANIARLDATQTFTGYNTFKNASNSTSAFKIQNAAGTEIFNVDTTNGKIGTANQTANSTNSTSLVLKTGDATGTTSNSGNLTIDTGSATQTAGSVSIGTGAYSHNTFIGNSTGTTALSFSSGTGGATFGGANTNNAFRIQNASGANLFKVDTLGVTRTGNFVSNGSFETDLSGWSGGGIARSSAQSSTGSYSATLSSTGSTVTTTGNLSATLLPSTTYTISYDVMGGGLGFGSFTATIAGSSCAAPSWPFSWTRVSCSFTTPASPTYNTFTMAYLDNGFLGSYSPVYFDGVRVEAGSVANSYAYPSVTSNANTVLQNTTNGVNSLQILNSNSASVLNVDTIGGANLLSNGDFEAAGSTGWAAKGSAAIAQSAVNQWQGNNSLMITTTTSANDGAKFAYTMTNGQPYTLSFYARSITGGSYTDLAAGRQDDGSTDTNCTLSSTNLTTSWARYTCTFTAGAQSGTPAIYIKKTGATAETIFIDGVQLQTGSVASAFNAGGALQVGGIINSPLAIQNKQDSQTAFMIQNSAGTTLLSADTTNLRLSVGSRGTATAQLYIAGSTPSGVTGQANGTYGSNGIAVQGRYVYTVPANGTNGYLQVYDASNPAAPVYVDSGSPNKTATSSAATGKKIKIQGKYAYVAGGNTLQVFDISNPYAPVSVGTQTYTSAGSNAALYVQGRYAYVGVSGTPTLYVFDISNPASIPSATTVSIASASNGPYDIYAQGRYVYIANGGGTNPFQIIDMSNPSSPSVAGGLTSGTISAGAPQSIVVQGRYAYLGTTTTLYTIDVSNPATPGLSNTLTLSGAATYLTQQSRYLYAVDSSGVVRTIDISTPATPALLSGTTTAQSPLAVQVAGRYLYVANNSGTNTLQIFDMGGTYTQQLEAGGIETDQLYVRGNTNFASDASIQGSLAVGSSANIQGSLNVGGNGPLTGINLVSSVDSQTYTTGATRSGSGTYVTRNYTANLSSPSHLSTTSSASCTIGYTVPVGSSNRMLLVYGQRSGSPISTVATGVTYNSVSMTQVPGSSGVWWYMPESSLPNDGASHNVVISGAGANCGSYQWTVSAWSNVDQANPFGTFQETVVGATATATFTTAVGDTVVAHGEGGDTTHTIGGSETQYYNTLQGAYIIKDSYRVAATTSTAITRTFGGTFVSTGWIAGVPLHAASLNITGALGTYSSNCSVTLGQCTDSSNILSLSQQYASASGAVLAIQNAGTGPDIQLGSGTIKTVDGTTSNNIALKTGTASAGNSGSITLSTGNATGGTAGNITIDVGTSTSSGGSILLGNTNALGITIGNGSGASAVSVLCGTGTCGFGNNAVAHTTTVGSATGAATTNIQGGTGGISIGNNGLANTIQIGNTTGAVAQAINIGNNATASSTSTITIGSSIQTSPITLQSGTSGISHTSTTTTGTAFGFAANSLTSGSGLSVTTTNRMTSGNLLVASESFTSTSSATRSGNVANFSRAYTSSSVSPALVAESDNARWNGCTIAHTVPVGGSNRMLLVFSGNISDTTLTTGVATGVTYNSVAMTAVPGTSNGWWYLADASLPNDGVSHNVVISGASTNCSAGTLWTATTFNNVDQSSPFGSFGNWGATQSANPSLTLTTVATDVVIAVGVGGDSGNSVGAGETSFLSGYLYNLSTKTAISTSTTVSRTCVATFGLLCGLTALPLHAPASALTVNAPAVSISSNCTLSGGSCTDTANVLSVNQQYSSATGTALLVQNSGTGYGLQIQNGSSVTALQVATNNLNTTDPGGNWGTATVLKVARDAGTLRSINANGTINASGADYAEWIPWTGDKPTPGTVIQYHGQNMVVSSPETAGFIGNDAISDQANAILVTFSGQVPVKISGAVNAGDYLVPNGDGTAHGVAPASASLSDYVSKVAVAVESSTSGTVKGLVSGPGASNEFNPQANQSFADLNISGTLTVNNLTVTGTATFQGNIIVGGHIITQGDTPTATINSAAGAGAVCTVSGNDTAGQITITTGSGGWTGGEQCAINFSNSYSSAPRPVITPANGSDTSSVKPFVDVPGSAPFTSWNLNFITADSGQHTYKFNYFNVQ